MYNVNFVEIDLPLKAYCKQHEYWKEMRLKPLLEASPKAALDLCVDDFRSAIMHKMLGKQGKLRKLGNCVKVHWATWHT